VREIENVVEDGDAIPFEEEMASDGDTMCMLTNFLDPTVVYTVNVTNPERFTPEFTDALSHRLAAQIGFQITGKRTIKGDETQLFNAIVQRAAMTDALARQAKPPRDADVIRARL